MCIVCTMIERRENDYGVVKFRLKLIVLRPLLYEIMSLHSTGGRMSRLQPNLDIPKYPGTLPT